MVPGRNGNRGTKHTPTPSTKYRLARGREPGAQLTGGRTADALQGIDRLVEIAEVDPERAERAVADIEAAGGTARAHVVDVTDEAAVARLTDDVLGTHGRVDAS